MVNGKMGLDNCGRIHQVRKLHFHLHLQAWEGMWPTAGKVHPTFLEIGMGKRNSYRPKSKFRLESDTIWQGQTCGVSSLPVER